MTRVAKAQRKVGIAKAGIERVDGRAPESWGLGEAVVPEPWPLREPPDEGVVTPEEPLPVEPDDEEAMRIKAAVRPEVQEHLLGLVRRIFLPPPLGTGARTVLFAGADGGRDPSASCVQAAELLSRQTARTVCLVDGHGALLETTPDDESDPPEDDTPRLAQPLFHAARPLTRNLWRASEEGGRREPDTMDDAKRWFGDLAARFDYLLLDAAAMQAPGEPSLLASLVDGVILVVDELQTRRAAARTVAAQLHAAGARLLGVVLTNRRYPIPDGIYRRV